MASIDLSMAVIVDTKQLDKLQEKMKQTDELFLKKVEKATSILPKGIEKVDRSWLQMMSKVSVYVDKLVEHIKRGFEQVCSKMDEMKEILSGIRQDFEELDKNITKSTWIQFFTTVGATIFSFLGTLAVAKGSVAGLGAVFVEFGAILGPLLVILGKVALAAGVAVGAFLLTDWILEITGARKHIDDFMFWLVEKFISIKDEIIEGMNYLADYPEERLYVFKQFWNNSLNSIVEGVKFVCNKIWEFLKYKPEWSIAMVDSIKSYFVDAWKSFIQILEEKLSSAWAAVERFFNEKVEWIKNVFDIGDFIKGVGKQIIDKFKEGAAKAWEGAKNFFKKDVADGVKNDLELSNSPAFTIPYQCGLGIIAAYAKGMKDNLPLLESTLDDISTKVETGLQIPVEGFASGSLTSGLGISADISATLNPIKDQFGDVYDHFANVEKDAHDKSLSGWQDWGSSLTSFLDQLFKTNITGAYQTLKSGFSDLFRIFKGGGAESEVGLLGGLLDGGLGEDGDLAAGAGASMSKGGGMLSKMGAALGPIGQIASVVMQIPQIVKQVWASIKEFAKGIARLFCGIGDFIKDINTELFLFIKYNYSLQHRYAKESNVGIGFIPVRAAQWDAYKY